MKLPSVKKLSLITDSPKELRKLLETKNKDELCSIINETPDNYLTTLSWLNKCYNPPSFHEIKMSAADEFLKTFGVEYIPAGHNSKSPAIEYCNAGDTYTTTLLFVNGSYRVGDWGSIVERGNYD